MTTIITITAEQTGINDNNFYEDRILKNILSDEYEVFYSGQNQGRQDYQLINAVNVSSIFRVYYRKKRNSEFMFLGSTTNSEILNERSVGTGINSSPNERLQLRLVVPSMNVENVQIDTKFEGRGCYKKSVLEHSNFPNDLNTQIGFYTL